MGKSRKKPNPFPQRKGKPAELSGDLPQASFMLGDGFTGSDKASLPNRYPAWVPFAVMVVVWLLFWWPVVSGDQQLYIRDLTFYTVPMKTYMMERFHAGEFPFWIPNISDGMPFFAEPTHQVLYPFNLVFFLTPTIVHGISWFIILHYLFAMMAFYFLARVIGLSRTLSLWASLLYSFCGYTLSIHDNVNYISAILWVPLGLATFIRGLETMSPRYSALTALSVAMLILASDTFNSFFLGLFCGVYLLLWFYRQSQNTEIARKNHVFPLVYFALSFGLAALVTAVQILPTWELLKLSVRQEPLTYDEVTLWSFPLERLIEFIQPYFYGSKYPAPHFIGQFMYTAFHEPWAESVYIGLIPVVLAITALFARLRVSLFWWLVILLSLAIGFGSNVPYYHTLLDIFPPLNFHRYLEKMVFWTTLACCVLAGLGAAFWLDQVHHLREKFMQKSLGARLGWTLGILILGTVFLVKIPADLWIWPHAMERSEEWGLHFYERGPHVAGLFQHWFLILGFLLALPWIKAAWQRRYLQVLLVMACVDLIWVHQGHVPMAPTELLARQPKPAALALIEKTHPHGPVRILYDDYTSYEDYPNEPRTLERIAQAYGVGKLYDNYDYSWIYKVMYNQNRLLFNHGINYNLNYINGRFTPLQQKTHKQMDDVLLKHNPEALVALSSVDFIVTPFYPESKDWKTEHFATLGESQPYNVRIVKPLRAVPKAYLAPDPIFNPEPLAVYKVLTGTFHDYRQQAEIHIPEPNGFVRPTPVSPDKARVTIVKHAPEFTQIVVDSPYDQPVFMILTDSFFPGWHARVDDQGAPIVLANHRFMAVPVPPGKHTVTLQYRSTYFSTGLAFSLLGILLTLGLIFIPVQSLFRRRHHA